VEYKSITIKYFKRDLNFFRTESAEPYILYPKSTNYLCLIWVLN